MSVHAMRIIWIKHVNRTRRYLRSAIGIMRHGCYTPYSPYQEWINDSREVWKGKRTERPHHAKHKIWYIGFQRRPKSPEGAINTPDGWATPMDFTDKDGRQAFLTYVPPARTNSFSRFLNKYTERWISLMRLRY